MNRLLIVKRSQAGRTLGQLGDPRPGVTVRDENSALPDIDWQKIPAGSFMMGSNEKNAYEDEKPAHRINLKSFSISRYLVTNAQYGCFIKAGGYANQDYWQTEAAKHWLEGGAADEKLLDTLPEDSREGYRQWLQSDTSRHKPRFWNERKWNNPNHPVVGVSWFEAMVFCCWLSELEKKSVRLPGEEEWEYAARGVNGLQYGWGLEFDKGLGNTEKTGLEGTSTVGLFPAGQAVGPEPESKEFGLYDMSGNVWEWMATCWGDDFSTPKFTYDNWNNKQTREDPPVNELRVTRGGSWDDGPGGARCSFRYGDHPDFRYFNLGFRVVFSLAADS